MKSDTLNANAKVAPWTASGQRQGFKFLVTQVSRAPERAPAPRARRVADRVTGRIATPYRAAPRIPVSYTHLALPAKGIV